MGNQVETLNYKRSNITERTGGSVGIWNTGTSTSGTGNQVETLFTSSASDLPSAVDAFAARGGARRYHPDPTKPRAGWFTADGRPNRRRAGPAMHGIDRGRRAVRVLGILFAVFVVFYLPFFAAYIVHGTCQSCQPYISPQTITAFEWLQYSGSMLNPIVYHVFNPDFRRAFLKILRCRASV